MPARKRLSLGAPIGCGVDVVDLPRFTRVLLRGGAAFRRRVFTLQELAYAKDRPRTELLHLAGRFAAKEAVIKAISQLAPGREPAMREVEIKNDRYGRPSITLHGPRRGRFHIYVSLSHVKSVAVASAIVTR